MGNKLTLYICSTIQSSIAESTPSNRLGHLTLAAYKKHRFRVFHAFTSYQNYSCWTYVSVDRGRNVLGTLTADRELSPQLSQRTPSKSNAYRCPISLSLFLDKVYIYEYLFGGICNADYSDSKKSFFIKIILFFYRTIGLILIFKLSLK